MSATEAPPVLCSVHRTYQAIHRPRVACEECWVAWVHAEDKRDGFRIVRMEEEPSIPRSHPTNPMLDYWEPGQVRIVEER